MSRTIRQLLYMPLRMFDRFRIWLMNKIHKDYIKNNLALRRGECNGCGECCPIFCKHLGKDGLCKIYNKRSHHCEHWAVDSTSLILYGVKDKCVYHWEK